MNFSFSTTCSHETDKIRNRFGKKQDLTFLDTELVRSQWSLVKQALIDLEIVRSRVNGALV